MSLKISFNYTDYESNLIDAIIKRRKKLKLTQQNIADMIDAPQSTIARFEAKLVTPRFETVIKICNVLNISINIADNNQYKKMNRIMIIGPSGAGKSELSRKLNKITKLPLYHLDNIFWNSDKTHISHEEFDKKLSEILRNDKWIIDGNYSRTYELRMDKADTIINYPLEVCLEGVNNRIGKKRDDLPWIEEEFDPEFKDWIINWFREELPKTKELLNKYKDSKNIIILESRKDADEFLKLMQS